MTIMLSRLLVSLSVVAALFGYTETIRCPSTGEACAMNTTCEYNCDFPCCNKARNDIFVYGSTIYLTESSICRSALHDYRISLYNKKARIVKIRRFQQDNCSLESSVKYGFSSSPYHNETCSVFEFVSPRISEKILDVVSMHSNYLYGQGESHSQVCVIASNLRRRINFATYAEWVDCNRNRETKGDSSETSVRYVHEWSSKHFATAYQCVPIYTDFSVITSIAFRKDARFFPERFTVVANKHDNVTLTMSEVEENLESEPLWWKDDKVTPNDPERRTSISLINVHESSSGIYSLGYNNSNIEESGYMQLIVRACPSGKFGDGCSQTCPDCLNGGVCHDITGECVCAPGFNGSSCENACKPGYVGKMCNINCTSKSSIEEEWCKGLLICLPSPYGCSCASGYTGLYCDTTCSSAFYGAGCLQRHSQLQRKVETCSRFYDACECENGWHGRYCNISYPVLSSAPSILRVTETRIELSFAKWSNSTDRGSGTPAAYEVVFKEDCDDHWVVGANVSEVNDTETYEAEIYGLKPGTQYTVGVVVLDESGNVQDTGIVTADITTLCDIPSMPPSDIKISSANQHIYVQWKIPPEEVWNCWEIHIFVKAREVFTNHVAECIKNGNVSCSFNAYPLDTWTIQVCAVTKGTKENCAKPKNITVEGTSFSSPVEVEIIKRSTSLMLSWVPPRFYSRLSHYKIKYEDEDLSISRSVTIEAQGPECTKTIGTTLYICYEIKGLKAGHIYVIEIIAFVKDHNEGIVINSFIVRLDKSSALPTALGVCIPILLILAIPILIIYVKRRKKKASSLNVKFLPSKSSQFESEFATCNEALDEMEIIETESISDEISNVISVNDLQQFVNKSLHNATIRKEFMSVPTGQMYPCNIAKLGENKPKNRYGNILPYDHSRVILEVRNGDAFSSYIHASYVHGYNKVKKYVATQGPLANTVNDFWRMVWSEASCKILMITNFVENGRCKCEKYWTEECTTYGDITLSYKDSVSYADFVIRTFDISKDKNVREVKQFHFTTWPDHGAPSNATPFLRYLKKVRTYRPDSDASIIIHCSAGIGRTGATILLDSMIDMGLQEKKVDVVNQLCSMRKQRMNIVENYDQYVFVYHALVEILCFEDTSVKRSNFQKVLERMKKIDESTGMTYFEKQFKALEGVNIGTMSKDIQGAYQEENQCKNRYMSILPPDRGRPFLSRDSSGYINAVYVNSFSVKNAYIATQYPLPETTRDFWSMIYEEKSKLVVILQEIDSSKEEMPPLWLSNDIQMFGEFEIACDSITEEDEMTVVNITLSSIDENNRDPISIVVIVSNSWAVDDNLPKKTSVILSIVAKVEALSTESTTTITAVCLDGATACGLFGTSLYICDQIKVEDEVDIFQAVKCIRTNRPQFIRNLEQYEFLFDIVSSYIKSYDAR